MTDSDADELFQKVPFAPVFEGQYLPTASYKLRQAICTTNGLDKLHSSSELRHLLTEKREATIRRNLRIHLLRRLGKSFLLFSMIVGSCIGLQRQPDLPNKVFTALRNYSPFHQYTGKIDESIGAGNKSRQLPITFLPSSVQASAPAKSGKTNASMRSLTDLTQKVLDSTPFQTAQQANSEVEKVMPEATQSTPANNQPAPLTLPSADDDPKKGRTEAGWLEQVGRAALSPVFLALFALQAIWTIVLLKVHWGLRLKRKIASRNHHLGSQGESDMHLTESKPSTDKQAGGIVNEPSLGAQIGERITSVSDAIATGSEKLPGTQTDGLAMLEGPSEDFELVLGTSKKSKAGSGDWEEVDTIEVSQPRDPSQLA